MVSLDPLTNLKATLHVNIYFNILDVGSSLSYRFPTNPLEVIVDFLERAYLYGFIFIQTLTTFFPEITRLLFFKDKDRAQTAAMQYEFLPLLITSVYCAIGVVWAFIRLSALYIREKY
jgi:alpha-1,3-glucosyltransferase